MRIVSGRREGTGRFQCREWIAPGAKPRRIRKIDRVIACVYVRLFCLVDQWVDSEELPRGGVVVAANSGPR